MQVANVITLCGLAGLALQGCVARTAYNVVRAPIAVGSQAADWATVSTDEADRERGRELRRKCRERHDPYYCGD